MSDSPADGRESGPRAGEQEGPLFPVRETRLAARRVAGEMVILSADDSSLYVLNELGTLLWEAADGRTPLHEIVERVVCVEYDVDPETGLHDAEGFLRELAGHGLIRLASTPAGPPAADGIEAD